MSTISLANGKKFNCPESQTILNAASAHNITLNYSCKTGRCGVCKAQVTSGSTKPIISEAALSEDDRSSGHILTCARTATSDISLDVEDLGQLIGIETKTLPCRIDKLEQLCSDVMEVVLRVPPRSRMQYLPGQYIDVIGREGLRRSYSIANAPQDDGKICLQIRKVSNGEMSRYWFDEAKPGDLLRLEGPLGTFFLRSSDKSQLVFLATGTGIAPVRAMLEQLAANPASNTYKQIHIYWGGRTEADLYWKPDYSALSLRFNPVLSRSPGSACSKGYVQDVALFEGIDFKDAVVYACGSEAMIASARSKLMAAGLSPKNFHSDAFVSSKAITH